MPSAIRWPIVSIDFEASALGEGSYPIEAGLAIWQGPNTPILKWSSLIAPALSWVAEGVWKDEAATIHNIPRSSLHDGMSTKQALWSLNALVGIAGVALCDGGKHDEYWLQRLVDAAGADLGFKLASWNLALVHLSDVQLRRYCDFIDGQAVPHRAGPDALLNLRAFCEALGFPAVQEVDKTPSLTKT